MQALPRARLILPTTARDEESETVARVILVARISSHVSACANAWYYARGFKKQSVRPDTGDALATSPRAGLASVGGDCARPVCVDEPSQSSPATYRCARTTMSRRWRCARTTTSRRRRSTTSGPLATGVGCGRRWRSLGRAGVRFLRAEMSGQRLPALRPRPAGVGRVGAGRTGLARRARPWNSLLAVGCAAAQVARPGLACARGGSTCSGRTAQAGRFAQGSRALPRQGWRWSATLTSRRTVGPLGRPRRCAWAFV